MKKGLMLLTVLFLSACSLTMNATPKQTVSAFLDKYKNQDESVLAQLDETINSEYTNEDYRKRYRTLMTNQYKHLEYEITDEVIENDNAVVQAQITVYDYASAINNANNYLNTNPNEFMIEDKTTINENDADDETTKDQNTNNSLDSNNRKNSINDMNNYDNDKFTDYKLSQMENVTDTITYTMEFTLTKVDGKWKMDSLSNADIEKLHGMFVS